MSTWSKQYTAPESVNGNNEYDVNSQLSLQMFVVPMNNSFYAIDIANSIANSYIKSIVYSANEFTITNQSNSTLKINCSNLGATPTTRTINGKPLSSNITLTASDVGARPSNWTPENNTWYAVGDDVFVGDHNISGNLCIKGNNGTPGITLYNSDETLYGKVITSVDINNYVKVNGSHNYDCNMVYDAGLYLIQNGSNCPSGSQFGSLFTMPYRRAVGNTTPDFATQIFIPNGDDSTKANSMFYRTSISTTWGSWQEVAKKSELDGKEPTLPTGNRDFLSDEFNKSANWFNPNGDGVSITFPLNGTMRQIIHMSLPAGTWTLKLNANTSDGVYILYINDTNIGQKSISQSYTFTTTAQSSTIKFYSNNSTATSCSIMLNEGSTALSYQSYNGEIIHQKKFDEKADKETTLSGYGITDAYTKLEIDNQMNSKLNIANINAQNYAMCSNGGIIPSDGTYRIKILKYNTTGSNSIFDFGIVDIDSSYNTYVTCSNIDIYIKAVNRNIIVISGLEQSDDYEIHYKKVC